MTTASFRRWSLLCTTIAAMGGLAAQAQTTPNTAALNAGKLQEVTVTATRRTANLQKTAAAVTAISGTTIQQQGEVNLQDVVQNVPGVTVIGQQRGYNPTIRGQGTDIPPGSGQGAVAFEEDGVYNIRAESGVIGYYDLARVEVLPGPQGTLYGVNSDGGVVNVISNDPVIGKYAGSLTGTIGNYHLFRGEGMINIPLNDVLAFRLSGAAINRTSWIQPQAAGDQVGQSFRAKLLYKPNDQLSILGGYEFYHIGGIGTNQSVAYYQNGDINNLKNPWGTGAFTTSGPSTANSQEHEYGYKLWTNMSYNFDNFAVLNIMPSYSRVRDGDQSCGPNGPPGTTDVSGSCNFNADPTRLEQLSSEERITNAPGSTLLWDIGAYHWNYRERSSGGGPTGSYVGQQSNAVFGELTYPLMNDSLRLIAGVRETFDHKQDWEPNLQGVTYLAGLNFSHFDYRLGVEYDAAPESMEYFTISTGYRPGGLNGPINPDGPLRSFATEQVTAFELGSKNRFLDDTLQVNGDVFYYIQHNYQLLDFYMPYIYGAGDPSVYQGTNQCNAATQNEVLPLAAECAGPTMSLNAHTIGAEFQTRYNVTPDDQISLNGAFLDAKFNQNQSGSDCIPVAAGAPAGGCYAAGNNPVSTAQDTVFFEKINGLTQPHAPSVSGNFSYQHIWDLANGATLTGGVQIFATASYFVHPIESPYSFQPAYWTQGLNTTYTAGSGNWSINGYVHNLSNYAVKTSLNPQVIGEPRTFGVVGSWHF